MASYGGTTQKCKACEKTVYLMDELTVDNKVYHKACFRCHHCKGTLKLSNYSSFEGVLYCQPHFDQLFKMTGSLDKSFEGTPKTVRVDRSAEQGHNNSKVSSMFGGTQEKCVACNKTVYPIEKVAVDGTSYHRPCFKCIRGGCVISPSNYVAHEHQLYCKHHHSQLFLAKGNFSQFDKQDEPKQVTNQQDEPKQVTDLQDEPKQVTNQQDEPKQVTDQQDEPKQVTNQQDEPKQVTDQHDEPKELAENTTAV